MESETVFDYIIGEGVRIGINGKAHRGIVIGRAEYRDSPPSYYVAYHDATGNYIKDWFLAGELRSGNAAAD